MTLNPFAPAAFETGPGLAPATGRTKPDASQPAASQRNPRRVPDASS